MNAWRNPSYAAYVCMTALAFIAIYVLYEVTEVRVQHQYREQRLLVLRDMVGQARFDASLLEDYVELIGRDAQNVARLRRMYRVRRDTDVVAAVLEVDFLRGYGGPIATLVAFEPSGRIIAVRVLSHRETPGLGDKIEARKSDWLMQFRQRFVVPSTGSSPATWQLRSRGGELDAISAATVTSDAVVRGIHHAVTQLLPHFAALSQLPSRSRYRWTPTNE